ncbi:hypothetical protein AB1Y70_03665 [Citrobacter portucalensis]|uniref:phosphoribosyltransferase-like protein n=1 Tax=Citrobacter portucalensis TaxID=1639133 RepID=UPI00345BD120
MVDFDSESFHTLLKLTQSQPWLNNKTEELHSLLSEECDSGEKRALIIELLNRFNYLNSSEFLSMLESLAESIITTPNIDDGDTQIVAMAMDGSADSSQYILYGLKPILQKYNWTKYSHVNVCRKAFSNYRNNINLKNIILVDEFVGSGDTVINRVRFINSQFSSAGITDYNIFVKVLVSTNEGFKRIKETGIDFESLIRIKKGITDFYEDEILIQNKKNTMLELESILSTSFNNRSLPSMGYGEAESLYAREGGNTPNNVFPIFWWPQLNNENGRKVLLIRAMGDA